MQNDCKVCNSPQTVEPNLCVTTPLGFDKYIAKTFLSDEPAFEYAPAAIIDWSLFPPIGPGETADSWRQNASLVALASEAASNSTATTSTPLPSTAANTTTTATSSSSSAPEAVAATEASSETETTSNTAEPTTTTTSKKVTATSTKTVTVTGSKTKTKTSTEPTATATGEGKSLPTAAVTDPRPDVDLRQSHQGAKVADSAASTAGPSILAVMVAGLMVQAMLF